ncbi:hypothetical protein [Kitasatospora sp. NPDC092286]|uniref:hypothetical protein n=1 Tax=Kitasatospora sp. NPDC092286 TaxID=3364087 RepID=UPI003824638D
MSDAAQMWITAVPPFGPDERGVLIGIDLQTDDPGQLVISALTDRGHEGEEGVFYLLPDDLWARYERTGDRLAVRVLAWPESIDQQLAGGDDAFREAVAGLRRDDLVDGRVTLLRREIETDFLAAPEQGVLLVEHAGRATLPELFAAFEQGETGFAVIGAD